MSSLPRSTPVKRQMPPMPPMTETDTPDPRTEHHEPDYVLKKGAEVKLEKNDHTLTPDRVEFLESGMVKLVFKKAYEKQYHPRERVEGVYSHTGAEEDAEWW